MTRLIIILLAIFLILTFIRNFIRRYKINTSAHRKSNQSPKINNDKKQDDENNIADAKFEEIK